jgi:hypothetical protein
LEAWPRSCGTEYARYKNRLETRNIVEQRALENWIKQRLEEGYDTSELVTVLDQQGVDGARIEQALEDIRRDINREDPADMSAGDNSTGKTAQPGAPRDNRSANTDPSSQEARKQARPDTGVVPGIELDEMSYRLAQAFVLRRYSLKSDDGQKILKAKAKWLQLREKISFTTPDGEEVFRGEADQIWDRAGSYTVTLADGTEVLDLDKKFTMLFENWKIRRDSGELMAEVKSQSKPRTLLRKSAAIIDAIPLIGAILSLPLNIIPRSYDVVDADGEKVAEMNRKISIRDRFDLEIESQSVPTEALVTALVCVDAIR